MTHIGRSGKIFFHLIAFSFHAVLYIFFAVNSVSALRLWLVQILIAESFAEFYAKQVSEKSSTTKQRMIKENRYTGGKKKFGYDLNDNAYYVPCEEERKEIKCKKSSNFFVILVLIIHV